MTQLIDDIISKYDQNLVYRRNKEENFPDFYLNIDGVCITFPDNDLVWVIYYQSINNLAKSKQIKIEDLKSELDANLHLNKKPFHELLYMFSSASTEKWVEGCMLDRVTHVYKIKNNFYNVYYDGKNYINFSHEINVISCEKLM